MNLTIVAGAPRLPGLHGTAEIQNSGSDPSFGPPKCVGHVLSPVRPSEVRA